MSSAQRRVRMSIVGLGARNALGLQAAPMAAAMQAGICRVEEHPYMVDRAGDPFLLGMDQTLETHDREDRMVALATSAILETMSTLPRMDGKTALPLYLGLPEPSAHFSSEQATALCSRLSRELLEAGHRLTIVPVTEGSASTIIALERVLASLSGGAQGLALVGGVDSFVDPDVLEGLDEAQRVASASNRWGFPPGEGAGMLAVCTASMAKNYRLPVFAEILSVASGVEQHAMHAQSICIGQGLADVMTRASIEAGAPIGRQYCDIDGERYREHEFSYALQRVNASNFVDALDYVSPCSAWGHSGAATAALLTVLAVGVHRRGFGHQPKPMVWCGSENGRRGAMVLGVSEGAKA